MEVVGRSWDSGALPRLDGLGEHLSQENGGGRHRQTRERESTCPQEDCADSEDRVREGGREGKY